MKSHGRFFWVAALLAVSAIVAASCGGGGEKEATPSAGKTPAGSPAAGADRAPDAQQQIIVQNSEPEFYDPHRSNFEQDIAVARMMFRGLYNLADDNGSVKVVPAMAAGEPQVNGNVYTVKLKSGLKWSDGQPLTAKDFVYGIQRECDPKVASPYQYVLGADILGLVGCDEYFNALGTEQAPKSPTDAELAALRDAVGVKAIDDTTLQITLKAPKPTFTTIMSLWAAYPARQDVIEKYGDKWTEPGNIVVNGPFIMTELVPKDHATFEPNPNWALEPKPALKKITVKFIDDPEVGFRAFQTGELDIALAPAQEIPTIEKDPTLKSQFLKVPAGRIWSVEMQLKDKVLSDFNVRLALSRAINRDELVKVVWSDAFVPATYWIVKGIPGHQGDAPFKDKIGYNPEAAKKALADAGYPNGQGFPKLTITVADTAARRAEAEFLQKAWKETLNIDVEINAVDGKTRSQTFNSENFQLFPGGWQIDYPDPENVLIGLFNTGGGNNKYNCSDPEIDAKLKAAATETDNTKRIQLLKDAETLVVTKLCGAAPLYQSAFLYLVKPKIGGVYPNGSIDASGPGNWCTECWYVKK